MNQPTIYFTIKELNTHNADLTPEIESNLNDLILKLSQVRSLWGKPMTVTSGLRSMADQMRINPKAPKSTHLTGHAADILDEDGSLKRWVGEHLDLMADIGLWFEDFASTPNWCHMQSIPPKSGKRVFIP